MFYWRIDSGRPSKVWVAGFLLCIAASLMSSGIALQLSWEIAGFTPIPVFIESRQILLPIIYPPQLHFKSMAASRKALLMVFLGLLVFKSNSLTAKSVYDAQLHNAHVAKGHENMQKSSQRHPLAWFSLVFSWLTQPPAEMSFKQQQMFPAVSSNPSTRLSQQTQNLNQNISVYYF